MLDCIPAEFAAAQPQTLCTKVVFELIPDQLPPWVSTTLQVRGLRAKTVSAESVPPVPRLLIIAHILRRGEIRATDER